MNLYLRVPTPHLGIDRRQDHTNFADQVGIHDRRALETCRPASGRARIHAIPLYLSICSADSGDFAVVSIENEIAGKVEARQSSHQAQHIVAHHAHDRQAAHRLFGKHCANR